jgi:Spy/CpxP family protein refolding chaperone
MTTITALLAATVFAAFQDPPAPAPAPQQEDGESRGARVRRAEQEFGRGGFQWGGGDPERMIEMRVRGLKEQLGLTDEQAQKATDIFKQAREAEQKLETDRQAKVRELLTDDQKKKYDEMIVNQNRAQGPLGWLDRTMSAFADRLKKDLSLDDATHEKVKANIEEFRKKIQERGEKIRQSGERLDWSAEMQSYQDGAKETGEKIKAHLSSEQKEKFDKIVEDMQRQRGPGGGGERRGPPTAEERATRSLEALKISEATEQAAVKSALLKLFEAEHAMGEYDREARGKLDEIKKDSALTDEQVNTKLNEVRTGRLEKDKALKAAQAALREIISARQELELIQQRVLR